MSTMVHEKRVHKRVWGAYALDKRLPNPNPEPEPEPGLLGDVVNGVETVADDAVSGVVGVVTTAVSDVNALITPPKASSSAAAGSSSKSSNVQPKPTATSPQPSPPSSSNSGNGQTNGGASTGQTGSSGGGASSSNNPGNTGNGSNSGSNSGSQGSTGSPDNTNNNPAPGPAEVPTPTQGFGDSSKNDPGSQTLVPGATPSGSVSVTHNLNNVEGDDVVSGTATNPAPVVNAGGSDAGGSDASDSLSGSTLPTGSRAPATLTRTPHSPSSTGSVDSGSGDNGGVNGSGAPSQNAAHNAPSAGTIAGVVVACILAMLICGVLIMRKWHRKRRAKRFQNWVSRPGFTMFGTGGGKESEKDEKKSARSGGAGSGGTRSARSSFGTTFDQGLRPFTPDSFFAAPSPATFSEIHATANTPTSFLTAPQIPASTRPPRDRQRPEIITDRNSLISLGGSGSSNNHGGASGTGERNTSTEAVEVDGSADGHAQYLLAPPQLDENSPNRPQLSPISVRPWSPSERWAFPKPPPSTTPSTVYYRTPSPPTQSRQSDRGPVSPLPPLSAVTPHPENNPFADPDASATHEDAATTAHTNTTNAIEDGLTGSVENIRRPFIPTLSDEMAVHRGDVIRVLQAFDDGWVQVEKISVANAGTIGERGLIPIDCLREAGEALPSFPASKRVSSYYGGVAL